LERYRSIKGGKVSNEEKVIGIFRRDVLVECHNRLQRRLKQEENPRHKYAIQKRIDLFQRRIAQIDEVLGRAKRDRRKK
jgi:hypothetical protein